MCIRDSLWELIKDYSAPDYSHIEPSFRSPIVDWIDLYAEETNSRGHAYITTGHMLLALLKQDHKSTQQILKYFQLDRTELSNTVGLAFAEWVDYSDHPTLAPKLILRERIAELIERIVNIIVGGIAWILQCVLIAISPKATIDFERLAASDRIEVCTNNYSKKLKLVTDPNDIFFVVEFLRRQTCGWHTVMRPKSWTEKRVI